MLQLDQVIDQLADRRKWSVSPQVVYLLRNYDRIVGARLSQHTHLRWIKNGTACIHCRSSMWSFAMQTMEEEIISKLNESVQYSLVKRLLIRIGNVRSLSPKPAAPSPLSDQEKAWIENLAEQVPSGLEISFKAFLKAYKENQHQ